jgi:hypothetical protein
VTVGFIRRLFSRPIMDFAEGDFVRCAGWRGVWWVERVNDDNAIIAQNKDRRETALLVNLRHCRPGEAGHRLDRRRK